jgi:hypothetical protein
MKRKQDSISFVIHNFTILSLVIAIPLLFLINNTTDVVGGQQTLQKTVPKSAPPGIPSITKVNTTGQAASQNAESLIRSIIDPTSLMSTVMNETGGNNKTLSSNVGPSHLKNSASENNLTNTSTDLLNTVTKNTSGLSSLSQQQQASVATNRSSESVNKNNIGNNSNNHTNNSTTASLAPTTSMQNTIVTNVDTILLAHQIIPPKDFIPIYDTSPYKILNGHLDAKIPCDANSAPSLQILVGHLPSLKPAQLQLIKEYSHPGNVCMYHVDIGSTTTTKVAADGKTADKVVGGQQSNTTTTINSALLLHNPSEYRIVLPNTSAVVVGVNLIVPANLTANGYYRSTAASSNVSLTNSSIPNHVPESNGQTSNIINSMGGLNKMAVK